MSSPGGKSMESIGQFLRTERELRRLSLSELSQTTRIPIKQLQRIEDDRFDELPGSVFVRGFLKTYSQALGLPPDAVLGRYQSNSAPEPATPAPMTAIIPPERGKRFGIAIALVILLILFTLALSIVLRPRERDVQIELSAVPAAFRAADAIVPPAAQPI